MPEKVVCGTCGKVLQQGSGKPIIKQCYKCIIGTTPGSPKDRLTKPSTPDDFIKENKKEKKRKPNQIEFSYIWLEADEKNPVKRVGLNIRVQTYEKIPVLDLALPISQLQEFIAEMEEIEGDKSVG